MKQQVKLSTFSLISTIICLVVLIGCTFVIPEIWWQTGWGGFIAILHIVCLYYMPLSIAADEHSIYINRSLKVKRIPIAEVKSVRLCPPTMGAIRVCGSGGYLGYWGCLKNATSANTSPTMEKRQIVSSLNSPMATNICSAAKTPPKWWNSSPNN